MNDNARATQGAETDENENRNGNGNGNENENEDRNTPETPIKLDDVADYDDLLDRHELVLLEFVTSGCGICASMEPVLGAVARSAPGAVATVNAGYVPDLADEFGVRRVPTLVVLKDGDEVARLDDGFQSAETVVEVLETHAAA
ncbi:thioredoxin domain protein (plasmid) [Natrialba magadii ATCC 43099]|uniref:Thioredoxin n=1 Tax=Natrialba magadii (strain ATCC 43099 / DSM 3394 / CCM 3739 / CIP 104546 / IAM 13178 / JCM 8861 / NBRC 102185 / NCIMB 2190 / MS3) TaxID=547559 RepID=D3T0Z7_NATMM|nr:thioredoxin family protein [Natrialba magadii]ADD07256.1 thioredoxin domain protein [Natrialba magadii ATCC 43099]ELY34366.1 thioredoxin [Natrialba magadii ATCC 43099]